MPSVYDFAEQLRRDRCFPHDLAFTVFRTHPNTSPVNPTRVLIVCVADTISLYLASPCDRSVNITGWRYHQAWCKKLFDNAVPPWITNCICYAYTTGHCYIRSTPDEGVQGIG